MDMTEWGRVKGHVLVSRSWEVLAVDFEFALRTQAPRQDRTAEEAKQWGQQIAPEKTNGRLLVAHKDGSQIVTHEAGTMKVGRRKRKGVAKAR